VCAIALVALSACSEQPEPQQSVQAQGKNAGKTFGEDRVWPGLAEGKCGATVRVVSVDGAASDYSPPETFFSQFESHPIDQGESPRPATDLGAVMRQLGAGSVNFAACQGEGLTLTLAQLEERSGLLVLSGKGLIKLVGLQGDDYITAIRQVREIRFAGMKQAAVPPAENPGAGTPEG